MIDAFASSVSIRMVRTRSKFANAQTFVDGLGHFGAKFQTFVRKKAYRATPARDVPVDQNIRRAFGGKLSRGNGEHICPTAETFGEQQNVNVSYGGEKREPKNIDADGDARGRREGQTQNGPPNRFAGGFPCLTAKEVTPPPRRGNVHARPPVQTPEHANRRIRAKVTRNIGMAISHDPRAHQHGYCVDANGFDANGFVVEKASGTTGRS